MTFDPVTLEVCWNRLIAVVNEQAAALQRTSFSSVVREAGDLSAGIFDRRGHMVAQAVTGTPGHINSMALAVRHFLDAYPIETLRPGDVLVTNDPWKTSGHLYDVTICTPVFRGEDCLALFASTCHMVDIGGRVYSAQARDAYEEGLFIPIVKLYDAGRPNETLIRFVETNTRLPDLVLGDFHAQVVGGDVGGRRLLEFMDEFGLARLEPLADEILGRTEQAMRAAIRALRPGAYEYAITSDGFDEPITLRARVEVRGDELAVDYSGSSPQSRHGINVVLNYTLAYTTYGIKAIVSPEVPNNEGAFRPLRITAPPGSILNARHPAPVVARAVIGHFLPHVISGALSQAIPGRVMAEGAANIWILHVTGKDTGGKPFVLHVINSGGTGALADKDGLGATGFPSGVLGTPVEVIESISPVVVDGKALRPDSGGAGRHRGGLGQIIAFHVRTREPWTCSVLSDRTRLPARGFFGGGPGALGEVWVDGARPADAKAEHVLGPGARVELRLPGGGGYGDPAARAPELVRRDHEAGYVTPPR
jgi:N-methylhydantoinase B